MKLVALCVLAFSLLAAPTRAGEHPIAESGMSFKPGKGLQAVSEDGNFKLTLRPRVQLLLDVTQRGDDGPAHTFQIRRARVAFTGHAFNPDLSFKMELSLSPRDLATKNGVPTRPPFLDWFLNFTAARDASIRVGQYKVDYSRQRVWSSGSLQMVDRSPTQGEFNLDRDIALELFSKDLFGLNMLRYSLTVGPGEGRDHFAATDFGLLYIARAELSPLGLFDDTKSVDFKRRRRPDVSLGVAYAFADDAARDKVTRGNSYADGGTADLHNATADVVFKWAGFSILIEGHLRAQAARDSGALTDDEGVAIPVAATRQGAGAFFQGGYLIPGLPLEVSGRYSFLGPLGESALSTQHELGAGASYYLHEHNWKIQTDLFRTFGDELNDGTTAWRMQLQSAF